MVCARCESSFVDNTAICSKCGVGFPLCNGCVDFWKSYACPSCGTMFANWKGIQD